EKDYPLAKDADIFVAPNGDDGADGSLAHPLATFEGAVAAVRRLKETKTEGGIKVAFMAGEYPAPVGIEMTDADSGTAENPITYCKYGDGDVVFNAGVTLPADGFEALDSSDREMFPEKYRDRIKKASLAEYGVDPSSLSASNSVFAGKTRLDPARWPNRLQSGNDDFIGRYQELHEEELSITLLPYDNKRISKYHNVDDMYMSGYYKYDWSASEGPVLFYDPETGYITPTINGYGLHKFQDNTPCPYYYFFNIPDELDRTDEYYIDRRTGYLYVMDPAGDYSVSLTGQMFTFNNADFISLVGLEFCYGTGDFMTGSDADDLTVDQCSFHNFRGYGFLMDGDRATFTNNEFYDVGGRNIDLKTGDRETLTSGGSVIENNLFEHFGYVNKTMSPAVRVWGCGVRIAHNEMCDSSNSAVTYSESVWPSNYVTVEYNYIHSVVTQSTDFGAIYAGRNLAGHGCVVRYNIVADVGNRLEQHNSLGLYLDDSESGQEVYGNIFFNTANHAIFTNGGRENKIYNNVIIEPDQNTGSEIHLGDSMYSSIKGATEDFTKPIAEDERITILELVPFRNELWASAFPTLAAYKYDLSDMAPYADDPDCPINPSYDEVYGNVIVATEEHIGEGVLDTYAERVVTFGTRVENSTVYPIEENPFFADPTRGDYRIDSEKAGFEIPYELIGRY
ncbi:MAG: right-handed parallel beta-helix repeat-containing protein, partial [Clostridia bacterium]|nr:right-handed parallel beta-helix repeat-containing protein [Clostridia bacterium]